MQAGDFQYGPTKLSEQGFFRSGKFLVGFASKFHFWKNNFGFPNFSVIAVRQVIEKTMIEGLVSRLQKENQYLCSLKEEILHSATAR
jgi:hypothetical protein